MSRHLQRVTLFLLAALLPTVIGCGKIPTIHYYILEPQELDQPRAHGTSGLDIGVEAFLVDPPYDQDRLVYRVGRNTPEVGFYDYHRWAAPLSRMLPKVVADSFGTVRGVASIEPTDIGRDYGAFLTGRVRAFEEIDLPDGQQVRVRLDLTLTTADGDALWVGTAEGETVARSDSVGQIVERLQAVLGEGLVRARTSLEEALSSLPDAG
jgi:ABC-type uncharacterized transport system auxiliary subunit